MNKTIELIKQVPGVKTVEQYDNRAVVVFEPSNFEKLIQQAYYEGKLVEVSVKDKEEWTLLTSPILDFTTFDYRIADLEEVLGTVANINQSAANSIARWLGANEDIF